MAYHFKLMLPFFIDLLLLLGMTIFARPTGTRPNSTLMGRILSGPIRNRVGYGFLKKKPEAGLGRVRVL